MTRIRRSGFTLNEVLISLVILAIIGSAFTRIITYQTRYFAHQSSLRTARSVARTGTNLLVTDLRAVQDSGGVDSVGLDGKFVRILVPYRFGLVCGTNGNVTTVSMLPVDSATIAMSVYKGFAWRNATGSSAGRYTYVMPADPTTTNIPVTSPTPDVCTGSGSGQAQIKSVSILTRSSSILDLPGSASGATVAAPVFFFQKVSYSFKWSQAYPKAFGLYRNVEGGSDEELFAPFDTLQARFRFYQRGDDTSRVVPPDKSQIRGLELVLAALSPIRSSKSAGQPMEKVVTSVFFKNVRKY
jgi:prepilin-type N-terminal cleavage/methylation domain-containing protein